MMRKKSPADRAMGTPKSIEKPQWRATALALATAALLGVSTGASALALGPVTVQSALGEPLRAEIDVPEITPDEVGSLRANIASPAEFRTAGLEYNSALTAVKITLERRPNGRYFLRLASDRAITDPFVDLMLETSWASGRIMRDYTMLFDPPNMRQRTPLSAQTSPVAPAPGVAAAPAPAAPPATRTPAAPASAGATTGPVASRPAAAASKPAGDGKQVTVQSGDTAGKIASANKPANISLDQMLVAMLRANPDAFIGGNVNRLKAGAVLDLPSAEQAEQTQPSEARRTVVAQSRDFNEFRRRLAEGTPATRISPAERQASGKVQAQVEDKKPGAAAPDKLTLSKGAIQGKGNADQIARERAAQDSATRLAELNKNIADLNKLGTATSAAPSGTTSAAKPGIAVPVGTASAAKAAAAGASAPTAAASASKVAAPIVPAPVAAAPVAASASAPGTAASASGMAASAPVAVVASASSESPASAPAAAASAAAPLAAAASAPKAASSSAAAPKAAASAAKPRAGSPPVETSFIDDMLDNPIVPATLGGVLALLLGFGFYRAQQRKKSAQVDSSFLESRLQPDSFFGASGGQRIDTNEGGATGSSMVYSPSQLDAAGDVDPVAEADVYLAYGRDLQAEEILKEAMRTNPQRVAIHSKLLEIYSKRRDAKAFELVSNEAFKLTRGEGPEWEHICELGQELDPSNALYRPGGQPTSGSAAAPAAAASGFTSTQATQPVLAAAPASDIDLDLDFSLGDDEPAAPPVRANPAPVATADVPASQPMPSLDMDFGAVEPAPARAAPMAPAHAEAPAADVPDLILDEAPSAVNASLASTAPAPAADPGMIEFDLGALSLDLDAPAKAAAPAAKAPAGAAVTPQRDEAGSTGGFEDSGDSSDPLATKLALAEEFNAIGDPDGARSLAQEVLAEASGDLKSRAQRLLAEIS
jgi:pilus assembly protein FimV